MRARCTLEISLFNNTTSNRTSSIHVDVLVLPGLLHQPLYNLYIALVSFVSSDKNKVVYTLYTHNEYKENRRIQKSL